jgi:hypothetical protein
VALVCSSLMFFSEGLAVGLAKEGGTFQSFRICRICGDKPT